MTELAKFKDYYRFFREVSKVVHAKSDINEVLNLVVSRVVQGIGATGGALCVMDKDLNDLRIRASYGIAEQYLALEPLAGKELLTWPEPDGEIHIINDIFNAPRVRFPQQAWDEGIRMVMDVPLQVKGQMFGFTRIYFSEKREFCEDELDFAWAVNEQTSCAIDHDEEIKSHILKYNRLATKVDRLSSLGRMAAGIAHEINNPLTGILLYSSNLSKKAPAGPTREGLEIIMQETQRCKKIIQGLLDFSREKKPHKVLANINKVIEKSLALMENELFIRRIKAIRDLDYDIRSFSFDPDQLEQVLINFLFNAVHAIDENGVITIRSKTGEDRKSVLVEVEDNGCGIHGDNLKRIFEPFYTTRSDGTGLGLSVSYGIVKNHQGRIEILSEPGIGTVITLILPVLEDLEEENPL